MDDGVDDLTNKELVHKKENISKKHNRNRKSTRFFAALKKDLELFSHETETEYSKAIMQELVERGFLIIDNLQTVIAKDVFARDIDVASQLINSVVSIVERLNHINNQNRKIKLDERSVVVKETQSKSKYDVHNNIIAVGTLGDMIRMLADYGDMIPNPPSDDQLVEYEECLNDS